MKATASYSLIAQYCAPNKQRTHFGLSSMAPVDGTTTSYIQETRSTLRNASVAPMHQSNATTRRTDAMRKLLSSERTYARDLSLVCDIHIPLAQGRLSFNELSQPYLLWGVMEANQFAPMICLVRPLTRHLQLWVSPLLAPPPILHSQNPQWPVTTWASYSGTSVI